MTDQRLAVVTGASSGIGEATARSLAARGYVVLAGVRRQQDAERIVAEGMSRSFLTSPSATTSPG